MTRLVSGGCDRLDEVECQSSFSGNILFADAASAKRAIVGRGSPLPPAEGTAAAGACFLLLQEPQEVLSQIMCCRL